jgi:hypothetical protein
VMIRVMCMLLAERYGFLRGRMIRVRGAETCCQFFFLWGNHVSRVLVNILHPITHRSFREQFKNKSVFCEAIARKFCAGANSMDCSESEMQAANQDCSG